MRLSIGISSEKESYIKKWNTWFAWRPVMIGKYIYWMQLVERKAVDFQAPYGSSGFLFEYRLKADEATK